MASERTTSRYVIAPGGRSLLGLARAVAAIRRLEFYVVELTIFSIPLLVVARSTHDLTRGTVIEGLVMFFVLYSLGDMVNCLADRDLDSVYKTRLSRAVYRIGVRNVGALVVAESIIGLGLAAQLAASTGRWLILGLVVVGVFLGIEYSIRPVYFKGRGLGHLVCLWLLLYFLPMLCAALFVTSTLSVDIVEVAAAYATVEMGIILINTSEDLPEDRAAGVRTTTVALGLAPTIRLAGVMVTIGGAGFCAFWASTFANRGVTPLGYLALGALAVTCTVVLVRLVALGRGVRGHRDDEDAAIHLVKAHGKLVPVAATLVGWFGVGCGIVALGARIG